MKHKISGGICLRCGCGALAAFLPCKVLFNVTQEIVSPESAEVGEAEFNDDLGLYDLRDAVKAARATRTCEVDGIEAIECDSSPCERPRWITVINGMEYRTGEQESR